MAGVEKVVGKLEDSSGEGQVPRPNLFALTIDADAGQIVKFEKVDSSGAPRDLSDDEKTQLATRKTGQTLEAIVEQAFEAGIGCLLGEQRPEKGQARESQEEAELRHVLVLPLMDKSSAHDLLRKDVLGRAILATAIQQTVARAPVAESGSAQQQPGEPPRQPTSPGPT
jgi:hypothetical protein